MLYLLVGIGGAIGATLRFLLNEAIHTTFPYATLLINILGSFILGFLLSLPSTRITTQMRLFFGTGMLGAFTTFSTFSAETVTMIQTGQAIHALLYATASIILGLMFALLGVKLANKGVIT